MEEGEKVDNFLGRTLSVVNKMKSNEESNDLSILTIDELHGSLLVHEQRMQEHQVKEQVLKVAHDDRFGRGKAFFKGGRGRGCERQPLNKSIIECFKGHKLGNFHYECPERGKKANDAKIEKDEELLLMRHMDLHQTRQEGVWFLDSGCSNHMTGKKVWFSNLEESLCQTVILGNEMTMHEVAKGNVRMKINGVTQVISDVYFVPELKNNFLSLGQFQETGLGILIKNVTCKVFHSMKGLTMQNNMIGNIMFYVSVVATPMETMCLQTELHV
ncbi:hypothetical protein KIW84_011143 [Lathyrus oleraceus]|uniref:Retrovirus-related Pol polyprotein from transposon TNT 1-94-like beta-barrel domain-containing protein n=1 Tax=Pisum sativum TaxID=3888 RepID=A0A9D5BEM9_PEA|nr:hypothetical protein KIW84_011143 [Pisum sativum]